MTWRRVGAELHEHTGAPHGQPARSPAGARPRPAPAKRAPARPAGNKRYTAESVAALQRSIGNAATTLVLQRVGPPNNIATLDEYLDRWNTPEGDVIALLGRMSGAEKHTVIAGYRDRLAGCLNFGEMHRAVANLGAELPVKLDWLQAAAILTRAISYNEIRADITSAPQSERDMLKNGRFKSFFTSVCDNSTIFTAVSDLHFDLATQLTWINAEANARVSLNLAKLKPLLLAATPADRDVVGGEAWRSFWTAVCTNATMAELVTLLFPNDLTRRLVWMQDEGTNLALVRAQVAATTDPAQKLAIFSNPTIRAMMVGLCNPAEMAAFALDLGGEWADWRSWMLVKRAPILGLVREVLARNLVADPLVVGFLRAATTSPLAARDYIRRLQDAQVPVVRGWVGTNDVVAELVGEHHDAIQRALNGELARSEQHPTGTETLLAGPTTSPFVAMDFNLNSRYTMSYWRDRVQVDVGVALTPAKGDTIAKNLLPSAISTWQGNISAAWNNKFRLQNTQRTIPLIFNANLGSSGANPVTVHSGVWVWPKLNAGNWFVPEPVAQPGQAAAVATAPVHEFGHLIGNEDEYSIGSAHYVTVVGTNPATDPNAVPATDSAGTTRYTNTASVMGQSGPALARHVSNILAAVNANLRPGEPAFSIV